MKVKIEIVKAGRRLHEGIYEIDDTESFAAAWKDIWVSPRTVDGQNQQYRRSDGFDAWRRHRRTQRRGTQAEKAVRTSRPAP